VMYAGMLSHRTGRTSKLGTARERLEKDTVQLLRYVTAMQEQIRDLGTMVNTLSYEFSSDAMQMSLVIDELEQEIKRVRMLPLNTITGNFQRMVRDLAQESGKDVLLELVGSETELDKRVLEQIKDPLIHLLRNAVDHGIETPQKRLAAGKPAQGSVTLSAEQHGQDVVISVSDDGAGLELAAIRKAIARQGKVDAEALNDVEVAESIFNIGISTSPIITDISGRGVGLDVVRRNLDALHGRIDIHWKLHQGTTFVLTLPLTLTSSRGLLVRCSNETFAIPHNAIERILYIRPQDIFSLEGQDTVYYDGTPITVIRLSDILELPRHSTEYDTARIPVVIVGAAERRMAFAVDELTGEQEVVIKGLGKQLSRVGGIAGASVMGDGSVILILNISDLLKLAIHGGRRSIFDAFAKAEAEAATRTQQRILIVDDSITTRTLEKNILESAGYAIQLATDGQEALELIASSGVPDLIVSDIAMPRMNGFDLTTRIKSEEKTMKVPVILVTSLDSQEDKAHGIDVGADAYIIKSQFDQKNLLETIEQLI